MSKLAIRKVPSVEERTLPIFEEIDEIADAIRERAFELFAEGGYVEGQQVADWLAAEQEICWSVSELIENDDEFILKIALAGFEPEDISITANPRELIIKAAHNVELEGEEEGDESVMRWSRFRNDDIYRRVELPIEVDIEKITAKLKRGLLTIEAPKMIEAEEPAKPVEVIATA